MTIKKKMTLAVWWKLFNPRLLGEKLKKGYSLTSDDYRFITFTKLDVVKLRSDFEQYFYNIDLSRLETNFQKSVKESAFQPIRDPYGWVRETQHLGDMPINYLFHGVFGDFFDDFSPHFDWIFKGYLYELTGQHRNLSVFPPEYIKLLILEHYDKDRRKYERLQRLYGSTSNSDEDISYERPKIPERVRIEVWRRDDGKCAKCGSRERLEYDHIIPISKGGSNTARNIELLCEKCNRSKGAKIE